jgi:hypothetical protein
MLGLHQETSCDTLYSDDPGSGAGGLGGGAGGKEVTHYKYRIQVGDEYTYRDSSYALDLLVQSLLDGANRHGEFDRLLAKAKGEEVGELAPRRPPVRAEEIRISVVVVAPPERKPEEGWHKVGEATK